MEFEVSVQKWNTMWESYLMILLCVTCKPNNRGNPPSENVIIKGRGGGKGRNWLHSHFWFGAQDLVCSAFRDQSWWGSRGPIECWGRKLVSNVQDKCPPHYTNPLTPYRIIFDRVKTPELWQWVQRFKRTQMWSCITKFTEYSTKR